MRCGGPVRSLPASWARPPGEQPARLPALAEPQRHRARSAEPARRHHLSREPLASERVLQQPAANLPRRAGCPVAACSRRLAHARWEPHRSLVRAPVRPEPDDRAVAVPGAAVHPQASGLAALRRAHWHPVPRLERPLERLVPGMAGQSVPVLVLPVRVPVPALVEVQPPVVSRARPEQRVREQGQRAPQPQQVRRALAPRSRAAVLAARFRQQAQVPSVRPLAAAARVPQQAVARARPGLRQPVVRVVPHAAHPSALLPQGRALVGALLPGAARPVHRPAAGPAPARAPVARRASSALGPCASATAQARPEG